MKKNSFCYGLVFFAVICVFGGMSYFSYVQKIFSGKVFSNYESANTFKNKIEEKFYGYIPFKMQLVDLNGLFHKIFLRFPLLPAPSLVPCIDALVFQGVSHKAAALALP